MPTNQAKPVLALDVYGTMIDPFSMETHLHAAFGEKAREASEIWRAKQLEYSFRRALMKKYVPFDVCTAQALSYVGSHFGISLTEDTRQSLLARYRQLPAYPDAASALETLSTEGIEMVAFSNGTANAVREVLDHAGILRHFSKIVSVDAIRTFKPDPAVYELLVTEMKASRQSLWVISSNTFDVIGAKACGLRAAWLRRDPKRAFDPWEFEPDLIIHDLGELKDILPSF
jgi:2-haloacid dehalogenase